MCCICAVTAALSEQDCLKYVVLANMLALSDINPFAAREAKVQLNSYTQKRYTHKRQSLILTCAYRAFTSSTPRTTSTSKPACNTAVANCGYALHVQLYHPSVSSVDDYCLINISINTCSHLYVLLLLRFCMCVVMHYHSNRYTKMRKK
jgi:hypothetical protein